MEDLHSKLRGGYCDFSSPVSVSGFGEKWRFFVTN